MSERLKNGIRLTPFGYRLLRMERDVRKQREKLVATREETQQLAERHENLATEVEQLETQSEAKQKVLAMVVVGSGIKMKCKELEGKSEK